jgi:2'-5' RNA ligase
MLQAKRASFGDPLAESIPTHITLLPPTELDEADLQDAVDHLDEVAEAGHAFPIVLRGTGTFRPVSPVVFVQVSGGLAECEQLEQAVRRGPLKRELDFYYHPHVTIAHHVSEDNLDRAFSELADFECTFDVREFHLYEHGEDLVWRAVQSFPLNGR